MACLIQLCGCSQSRRTGTDDSDGFSSACQWPPRSNQAFLEGAVDDGDFDVLDRDWICVDTKDTRSFAWGWADPAGELRKVVCCKQAIERILPLAAINEVVPVGD